MTRRPVRRPGVFLRADWRHLLMINYEIDPATLDGLVPRGTELDHWGGRTFVSLVGFRFLRTRVLSVPVPFHRDFDEVNLRFYVRRLQDGEWRRGVVFVREVVPRRLIAWVARVVYNENYAYHPMRNRIDMPPGPGGGGVCYEWKHAGRWFALTGRVAGEPAPAAADSEEAFITEHYWGYARQRDGSTVEYEVEHPPWRVWRCGEAAFDGDAAALYGAGFAAALGGRPSSAFVAEGSAVAVRRGRGIG